MTTLLQATDVVVEYKRRGEAVYAVVGASISVEGGQIVGLVGESGCGKSSLARAIVGLERPKSGLIQLNGQPLAPLTRAARPRASRKVQMIFQNPYGSLNPRLSVRDQLEDAIDVHGRTARNDAADSALSLVGLSKRVMNRYPHELSGGQRQRIAIARALASRPDFIVLDEPLASLDTSAQAQIANLLQKLALEQHVGMLLISHDLAIVRQIASTVAVMYLGQIVEVGPSSLIWDAPLHPYTEALISSIPVVEPPGVLPYAVLGEVPDPSNPPGGCRFNPRCPYAMARCKTDVPQLVLVDGVRKAACWLQQPSKPVDLASVHRMRA